MEGKVAVVGLGVIGGSLGMALSAAGYEVIGIDRDAETLRVALETQAAREVTSDLAGAAGADVVFLALPVAAIPEAALRLRDVLAPGTVVTDVGSTKAGLVAVLEEIFSGRCPFVGGHPMAGSELAGIKGADPYLFENAIYVLTPTPRTDARALATVEEIVRATGARPLHLSPEEHDVIVAATSHLPHLLAVALMLYAGEVASRHPETMLLAAGGFRDVTRVAASPAELWRDIYAHNRERILEACRSFRALLARLEGILAREDFPELARLMAEAAAARAQIPLKMRGFLPAVHEVVVTVPDRPGTIAHVAGILGREGINITDIEILRVREGEGGTIRIAFATAAEADSAYAALRENGVVVKRR